MATSSFGIRLRSRGERRRQNRKQYQQRQPQDEPARVFGSILDLTGPRLCAKDPPPQVRLCRGWPLTQK